MKLLGVALPFIMIIPFIINTQRQAYRLTGTRQFSLFTGWQIANNVLYIYDQIQVDSNLFTTPESKRLNRMTAEFFSHIPRENYRSELESFGGNFFIRWSTSPLKQYLYLIDTTSNEIENIRYWGKASAVFESFGKPIAIHHPLAYLEYFVLPNTWHYFFPPLLHLAQYNYGGNTISPIAKVWFHYPNNKVHCVSHNLQQFLIIYTALFFLFNLYFLWFSIKYIITFKFSLKEYISLPFWIFFTFLTLNFLFSICATVNIIRYQYIPMFILLAITCILSDYIPLFKGFKGKPRLPIKQPLFTTEKRIVS